MPSVLAPPCPPLYETQSMPMQDSRKHSDSVIPHPLCVHRPLSQPQNLSPPHPHTPFPPSPPVPQVKTRLQVYFDNINTVTGYYKDCCVEVRRGSSSRGSSSQGSAGAVCIACQW
jgi:hypothetical protein